MEKSRLKYQKKYCLVSVPSGLSLIEWHPSVVPKNTPKIQLKISTVMSLFRNHDLVTAPTTTLASRVVPTQLSRTPLMFTSHAVKHEIRCMPHSVWV